MKARHIAAVALAAAICALVGAAANPIGASGPPPLRVLTAEVDEASNITLLDPDGVPLDAQHGLPAGQYAVHVNDPTFNHNFHLLGAALVFCLDQVPPNNCSTLVDDTSQESWEVVFQAGEATYQCDPHLPFMQKHFRTGVLTGAIKG